MCGQNERSNALVCITYTLLIHPTCKEQNESDERDGEEALGKVAHVGELCRQVAERESMGVR